MIQRIFCVFKFIFFSIFRTWNLVYDSTIPIPDYTLYVTTGVTCALAWGLPTTPAYPETDFAADGDDEPQAGYNDRHDTNRTTTKITSSISNNASSIEHVLWKYFNFLQSRRPDSYYFQSPSNYSYCPGASCSYDRNTNTYNYQNGNSIGSNYQIPYTSDYDRLQKYAAFTKYMTQNYFKPYMQYNAQQKYSPHITSQFMATYD